MNNKKIVIAGGSGFIGRALAAAWSQDNEVIILTRGTGKKINNSYLADTAVAGVHTALWNGETTGPWAARLEGCDLLLNLAGRTVNCRYTEPNKNEILRSRICATAALGAAIAQLQAPPKLWINAGSATIYRNARDRAQDEANGEIENDFSVQVCKAWEQAFNDAPTPHTRKAILRMAIVLGRGGVLVPYSRLVRLGLGGPQGDGRQMFSWVHIDDLRGMIEWLLEHEEQSGIFNAAAPAPLPNHEFMRLLRSTLQVPFGIPAPAWLLKIAARIIGTETELLLKSRWVIPGRLLRHGFTFRYPTMHSALAGLMTPSSRDPL